MGKKLAAVFFIFLLSQTTKASEIKAMAGMNLGKYLFSSEMDFLNPQQKSGFDFGLGLAFYLDRNIKLEINILYSRKGAKTFIAYAPENIVSGFYKNSTLCFPILFKYQFLDKASPYIAFGPEFVFFISHHLIFSESEEDFNLLDNTKTLIMALNAVVGYELPIGRWGLFAEVRYNRYLGNFLLDSSAKVKSESFVFLLGGVYYL
jgi:hypothetical protein